MNNQNQIKYPKGHPRHKDMEQVKVASLTLNKEQSQGLSEIIEHERGRLLNFIEHRVPSHDDAEDILQDVFFQLIEAKRLMKPIERVTSWLFTVARNKITDRYRKKKPQNFSSMYARVTDDEDGNEDLSLEFPALSGGPEAEYFKNLFLEEMEKALDELPSEQKTAFLLNELENVEFKEMAEQSGETVNTWISRKRYAVLHLRKRLKGLYDELSN